MAIFKKPSIKALKGQKRDIPMGLWQKCPVCSELISEVELKANYRICPKCDNYFIMTAIERIRLMLGKYQTSTDSTSADSIAGLNTTLPKDFTELEKDMTSKNILNFKGYSEKVKQYQEKLKIKEAVITGITKIGKQKTVLAVMDFRFLGASMGSVVGEKITRAIEKATKEKLPVIIISASGGARMHEGILSLMQMAKTSAALSRHAQARLPYISILTHPTTGGVTASFATLGDLNFSEPGAMIGFAGPRVVKETTHQTLPKGFQTAEFMLKHGLIDKIVPRLEMPQVVEKTLVYIA